MLFATATKTITKLRKLQGILRFFVFQSRSVSKYLEGSTFKAALKKESACMVTDFVAIINSSQ